MESYPNGKMKKKRKPISEETKRKISKSVKQYRLGKLHSEATKQKMSLSQKGNKGRLGKPHSNETKDKISNSLRGENHPMYGKHLSLETKVKIGQSGKGREHSNESKLKMSESRKRLYETGWESTCGRCKKIPYDSKKYGVIKVDGSWEFAVAIYLDSIAILLSPISNSPIFSDIFSLHVSDLIVLSSRPINL